MGDDTNLLDTFVIVCICVSIEFAYVMLLLKLFSIAGGLEASLSLSKNLYHSSPSEP